MQDGAVHCTNLDDLSPTVKVVAFSKPFGGVPNAARLRNLQYLSVSGRLDDDWLLYLSKLPKLTTLRLSFLKQEQLPNLARLKTLTRLVMYHCPKLKSLECIRGCESLHSLCVSSSTMISDLSPIGTLHNLHELWIDGSNSKANVVRSLIPVGKLEKLQYLQLMLRVDKSVRTPLRPLRTLRSLLKLVLPNRYQTSEYDFVLAHCPKLSEINFPCRQQYPIPT